jgi:UDP-3-O-[3-hydroxymyristoyl] glucosamine N-acyltransferase
MKLADLSEYLNEQGFENVIDGDSDTEITSANTLEDATENDISFLANPRYKSKLATSRAAAILVKPEQEVPPGVTAIRCDDPYAALTATIIRIHGYRRHPVWGVDERASIDEGAKIGENANIGPFVTICRDVVIGANATIYPGCFVGEGVVIGDDVILYPNVVIYDGSKLGDRVALHAGTVVGQDGLGYAPVGDDWLKIPQIGNVQIDDDVEMGADCALDRATLGVTQIGKGTKLSDHVVIGHGTKMGERCMLVAQVGIAGSVTLGNHVILHGQVGISGHTRIGDNTIVGGKSGVWSSIPDNVHYHGNPAIDTFNYRRQVAVLKKLPELNARVKELEARIQALQEDRGRLDDG